MSVATMLLNGTETDLVLMKSEKNETEFNYVPLGEKESIKLTIGLEPQYVCRLPRKQLRQLIKTR